MLLLLVLLLLPRKLTVTMLIGSLYASYMAGKPTKRDWPERVVDAWLRQNAPDQTSRRIAESATTRRQTVT